MTEKYFGIIVDNLKYYKFTEMNIEFIINVIIYINNLDLQQQIWFDYEVFWK